MYIFFNELYLAYLNFWNNLFNFKGETTRKDWWYVQLANLIITLITLQFFHIKRVQYLLNWLHFPQIAIELKRLNNFGKDWK